MTPIIAGRFKQESRAVEAAAALRRSGFGAKDVTVFLVSPPGQDAADPIGGDCDAAPSARHAPALHVVEPVAFAAEQTDAAAVRSGGILVAVRAVEFAKRVGAVNVLRAEGAHDIERADGTWQDGRWIDFDPLKPPLVVDLPAPEDVHLRE